MVLAVIAAMHNSKWHGARLLYPDLDSLPHLPPLPHLHSVGDAIDADGSVSMSAAPGPGEPINFECIKRNMMATS